MPPAQPDAGDGPGGAGDAEARWEWCLRLFPNSDYITIVCGVRNLPTDAVVEWSISDDLDFDPVGPINLGVLVAKGSPSSGTVTATVNGVALPPIEIDTGVDFCSS